jgi:transcriptional regulator with XRE-family HTH domain
LRPEDFFMSMTLERFGEAVRSARKKQEYSQEELASAVDVSRTYLSQIEQGRAKNLSLRLAERLSTTLGIESPYQEEGGESLESIPASLRDFAEQDDIPDGDVRMLARIEYRGQRPQNPQGWRVLYNVIKTTSQPGS